MTDSSTAMPGVAEAAKESEDGATVPMAVDPVAAPAADVSVPASVDGAAPVASDVVASSAEAASSENVVPSLMFRCTKWVDWLRATCSAR